MSGVWIVSAMPGITPRIFRLTGARRPAAAGREIRRRRPGPRGRGQEHHLFTERGRGRDRLYRIGPFLHAPDFLHRGQPAADFSGYRECLHAAKRVAAHRGGGKVYPANPFQCGSQIAQGSRRPRSGAFERLLHPPELRPAGKHLLPSGLHGYGKIKAGTDFPSAPACGCTTDSSWRF